MFTIRIEKPKELDKTLNRVREKLEKSNGYFKGDLSSGIIRSDGVEGSYNVTKNHIEIAITKNPYKLKLPVELLIRRIIRECSS